MTNTLVIDQGTHASRAILYSSSGELIDQTEEPVHLNQIDHEHIEQDSQQILQSIDHCITALLARNTTTIHQAALTTQRSTVLAWQKHDGQPLSPALSWQDRRSARDLEQFLPTEDLIKQITGLPLSPHYGVGKLRWLLQQNHIQQQTSESDNLCIGPLVSYLLQHLLPGSPHLVDHSNAHRTLLFDIEKLDWSKRLLKLFEIPAHHLPQPKPMQGDWGRLQGSSIPLKVVSGDQNAALHAQGPTPDGVATVNIGTGAFILMPQHSFHRHTTALLQGISKSNTESCQYLLEGTVNGAGSALSWAQEKWPIEDLFKRLDGWMDETHTPPLFINTVGGVGSPWWRTGPEPYFSGPKQISVESRYVAIIESIVFLLQHNIEQLKQLQELKTIRISGGLSQLNGVCQKLANLSGVEIIRFCEKEATARGAAWLASDCPENWRAAPPERHFYPTAKLDLKKRYQSFTQEIQAICTPP